MVPSLPIATPCGSPGSSQRFTTFESRVATGVSGCAMRGEAAIAIATRLLVNREREILDDGVGEEALAHLPQLTLDLIPRLAIVCKRDAKQLAGADIFHPFKAKRAERMLNGLPLRIENGRLQLDDDGGVHVVDCIWLLGCWVAEWVARSRGRAV